MTGKEIDKLLRISGMAKWQLASAIGVSEPTLYRWLRHELPADKKERLLTAIRDFSNGGLPDEQHG